MKLKSIWYLVKTYVGQFCCRRGNLLIVVIFPGSSFSQCRLRLCCQRGQPRRVGGRRLHDGPQARQLRRQSWTLHHRWGMPSCSSKGIFITYLCRSVCCKYLKNLANPGLFLFIFVLFKYKFYRKNCRREQYSNSDHRSRRRARWPLDHHHCCKYFMYGKSHQL